ncbi:MAG: shikimate dehydrogenase, partial [Solirubrobacterales bacterium]
GINELADSDYAGVNVTVPHKEAALQVADEASELARTIGAANTLIFSDTGIRAENTDGAGLAELLPGDLAGRPCLVLGAGGAARAAVWALAAAGGSVSIWNRTASRATGRAAEMGCGAVESPQTGDYEVIVNASAAGLDGADPLAELPLDPGDFGGDQVVVDMVYGAGPGPLVEAARSGGARTVDGIDVLVAQGALSLEIWTGLAPSREVMERAARAG